jgi:hypothetical protein
MRYELTALEGFRNPTSKVSGVSFMVVDTFCNHTVMATVRTEDLPIGAGDNLPSLPWERRAYARRIAEIICDELNENDA